MTTFSNLIGCLVMFGGFPCLFFSEIPWQHKWLFRLKYVHDGFTLLKILLSEFWCMWSCLRLGFWKSTGFSQRLICWLFFQSDLHSVSSYLNAFFWAACGSVPEELKQLYARLSKAMKSVEKTLEILRGSNPWKGTVLKCILGPLGCYVLMTHFIQFANFGSQWWVSAVFEKLTGIFVDIFSLHQQVRLVHFHQPNPGGGFKFVA